MAKKESKVNIYKAADMGRPEFFSSGSVLLDCALGGGWAENRYANIIGNTSTGKSLLAIIACANYRKKYPKRKIYYVETEAAFDPEFAQRIGLPQDNLFFPEIFMVEELFKFIEDIADQPSLVIIDSMDALTTESELEAEFESSGYAGARKAERMSSMFRQLNQKMSKGNITLIIVSQTRDKLGVVFGRKWTRAGGRALDFYASQIVVLTPGAKLTKEVSGIKRSIGSLTTVVVDKNKVGAPYRTAVIPILYSKGLDDVKACADWLKLTGALEEVTGYKLQAQVYANLTPELRQHITEEVIRRWEMLELQFMGTDFTVEDTGPESKATDD